MNKLLIALCGMVLGCILTRKVLSDLINTAIKQAMVDMDK